MGAEQRSISIRLGIVVEPDGNEFHAYCPALKGLHTSGKTEEEALQNAKDAAMAYLASLIKHGDSIPVGCITSTESRAGSRRSPSKVHQHIEELVLAPV